MHLAVAISKIIVMGFSFGFGDLIQCLILWCGTNQHNFCNIFIYMLACFILGSQILMAAGFALQTGTPLSSAFKTGINGANDGFTLVYTVLVFIFYTVAVVLSFKGYKEFKFSLQRRNNTNAPTSIDGIMGYGTLK